MPATTLGNEQPVMPAPNEPTEPPPLSFEILTSSDHRRDALRLVADSIAQQRQVASSAIIFHPVCFVGLMAACTFAWRRNSSSDLGTTLMAVCGLVMVYLAAVRLYTASFLKLAEDFHCDSFVAGPSGSEDLVLAARFGSEIIGTLVLRLEHLAKDQKQTPPPRKGNGLIRAWTTKLRYRNKGIGADLLRFAVAVTRSVSGQRATVAFDPDHANSPNPLSRMFDRPFQSRDRKAAKALEHALNDVHGGQGGFARRAPGVDGERNEG
ncbi:hypothetical protein HIM_03320 [Hirsutella minnesotensis 3608]|uniref:Uncharacterized protein n=1 Tax=Hirsutella minnesotensis 3608 TaxID=1043627 RepID=A0A0F8A6F7_9HYPO|nr:hypothetical protein HIM_03320 [Hirsutella minnesotensis 3608]